MIKIKNDYKRLQNLIRYIENLCNKIDEDYYKPTKTKSSFDNNNIEYESRGDKNKNLLPEDYLDIIRPYLRDKINNNKALIELKDLTGIIIEDDHFGEWKIQLKIQINFISSLDTREICTMDSKIDNVVIMMGNETDDIIKKFFESFRKRYNEGLERKNGGELFCF